ncbi:lytic transglycosylase [Pseudonocardia sp. GCM10023141]|uniref:lytic transglycosylase n=1 Tax=Pseudonocardia sp. GCM10023141 TaxID=3252653 RepID=UPI00361703CF
MGKDRRGGAVVTAVVLAVVLATPQSRSETVATAPADPPRVQVELGALQRAGTPLPVVTLTVAPVPAALAAQATALSPAQVLLEGGIPVRVLAAYRHAADLMGAADPGCRLDWALLAGIGRIESGHAAGGRVDAAGTTRGRILGPVLDGSLPGSTVVTDTDGGVLDGDVRFDRATGPMQFLPATWRSIGADGNADGVADPNNVDDAALGAARYLCAGGGDLSTTAGAIAALFRYNRSAAYGATALAWAQAYRTGATAVPDQDGPVPAAEPGPQVLAAAEGGPGGPPQTAARGASVPEPQAGAPVLGPAAPPRPASPAQPAEKPPAPPTTATSEGGPATPPVTPPPTTTPQPTTTLPGTTPPTTSPPVTAASTTTMPVTTPPTPACPAVTVAASTTRVVPDTTGLLLRFALPALPAGCRVATATLRLDPGPDAAGATLTVRRPTAAWSATTAAEPASVGPDVASAPVAGVRRFRITGLVTVLYAGPDHGLLVRGAGAPAAPVQLTVSFVPA